MNILATNLNFTLANEYLHQVSLENYEIRIPNQVLLTEIANAKIAQFPITIILSDAEPY